MILDTLLNPLLTLDTFYIVLILGLTIAAISTAAYKIFTDQTLMKSLRDQQKSHQKSMKENRNNPDKLMRIQKQAMEANMQYMMQSMKPMIFTFLPIILIFGWANGHLLVEPLQPEIPFTGSVVLDQGISGEIFVDTTEGLVATNNTRIIDSERVDFEFNGVEGEYLATYTVNNNTYDQHIIIDPNHNYADPVQKVNDGTVKELRINQNKLIVMNLFGWKLGWLGAYIIIVMITSILLKKIFKIH